MPAGRAGGTAAAGLGARGPVVLVTMAVATVLVPGALIAGLGRQAPALRPAGAAEAAHTYNDGGMIGFGSVGLTDPPMPQPLNSPVFSGVATPDGNGYLLASADGGVFAFGDATFEGSAGALPLQGPIVAMAHDARRQGLLAGRARRRRVRLRRRPVLRLHGQLRT